MKKRITALILALVMILPLAPSAFAETLEDYSGTVSVMIQSATPHEYLTVDHGGTPINLSARTWNYLTSDGKARGPAWCAQHGYNYPSGYHNVDLTTPYTNPQVTATFASGSGIVSLSDFTGAHPDVAGLTEEEYGYASQVALWGALGQVSIPGTSFGSGADTLIQPTEDAKLRIFKAIQHICNSSGDSGIIVSGLHIRAEVNELGDTVDLGSEMSLEDAASTGTKEIKKETIGGTAYYTREFTVSVTSAPDGGKIAMTLQGAPAGTILAAGTAAMEYSGGTWYAPVSAASGVNGAAEYACRFKVCIPTDAGETTRAGSISVHAAASSTSCTYYYITNSNAFEQDFLIANPTGGSVSAAAFLKWGDSGNPPPPPTPTPTLEVIPASIRVLKTGESGEALPGAEFSLDGNGGYHAGGTTDSNGSITWTGLPADQTYTVTETGAPDGYQLTAPVNVVVSEGETKYITVTDAAEKHFRVIKQDAQNKASLAGATFRFEQIDGDFTTDGRTLGDGTIEFVGRQLPYGSYRVTEIDPPAGYEKDNSVRTVDWTGTADVELVFTDVRKPGFEILKVDAETGSPLTKAVFNVYKDGKLIDTVQTNELGLASVSGLSEGYYEVEEIVAPDGYVVDRTRHGIHVDPYNPASSPDPIIRIANRARPALRIVKYDGQTRQPLLNTIFAVYRNNTLVGEYTTDASGEIYLYDLTPGTYRVEEKSAPDSHVVNSTPQEIELEAGVTAAYTLVFLNYLKPGIRMVKLDSQTLQPLANARFRVSKVGGGFSNEYTSVAGGEIELTGLEPGSYTVEELSAPDGYLIDDARRVIRIEAGENAEFVFTDTKKPTLRLVKLDSLTMARLPGATFRIARIEDGAHYLDRVTDANGEINVSDLEPGVYSVQEMSAPEGYVRNSTEFHIELFPGQMSRLVVSNDHKPDMRIIKQDADTGEFLAGATFKIRKADGSTLTSELTGTDGEIFLNNLEPGVYEVTEQAPPVGYLPARQASQLITLEANKLGTVIFQNYEKPTLTVNKISSVSGEPLQGAKFRVTYRSNNTETGAMSNLGNFLTDAKGQFRLTDLTDGWYTVTELESITGYSIKEATQEVYIKGGEDRVLTFENIPLSALVVYKYDTVTGEAVSGAVFQVKKLTDTSGTGGTVIGTYTTGANGSITVTGLAEGVYVVEELRSDSGHVIDSAPQTAYISGKRTDVVELYFGNTPKGALLIKKKDASTHEPMSGVQFLVTNSDGAVVGNANGYYTTDSAGTIRIDGIDPGETLIVKETRTRDGYVLDDVPQSIRIKAGQVVELEFLNARTGSLLIKKINAVTHAPLSGVQFYLTDSSGSVIGTGNGYYTTDSAGTILVDGLKPGMTVIAKETRTKDGYVLDDAPQVALIKSNRTATLEFRNAPNGGLIIRKIDSVTRQPLAGAVFTVRTSAGEYVDNYGGVASSNGRYTTDESGQIHLYDLEPGSYVVTEVEAPEGYVLNTQPQTVKVNTNDTQTLTFSNPPKGNLVVQKFDKITKEPLEGAQFKITTASGELVADDQGLTSTNGLYTTDQQGRIVLSLLNPDTYIVTETKAPDNYKPDGRSQTVVVRAGDTQTLSFYDDPLCVLTILKRDANTLEPLEKAAFSVRYSDGRAIGTNNGRYITGRDGTVTVTGMAPNATILVTEEKAPTGYLRDETPKSIVVRSGAANSLVFDDEPTQTLIIRKFIQGTDNEPLPGVGFRVVYGSGASVGPDDGMYYTDEAGEIVLPDLTPGMTVIAREVSTVEGFVLNGTPQDILIEEGRVQQLTFWNSRQGTLIIRKLDSVTGAALPGAEFRVSYADGRVVDNANGHLSSNGVYTTDSRGEITISGITGTVVVEETKAPQGYALDHNGSKQTVVVNAEDTQTLNFYDTPLCTLTITKRDAKTLAPLAGAEFTVKVDEMSRSYVTGKAGTATVTGITPGATATVTETKAPGGYVRDALPQTITLKSGADNLLTFDNEPTTTLVIQKYIQGTDNEPLAGVAFRVTDGNGGAVGPDGGLYYTDRNGEIVLSDLTPGMTVSAREVSTVEGFVLNGVPQDIEIKAGQVQHLTFWNARKGTLVIRKVDSMTGAALPGAEFKITYADGSFVDNANGHLSSSGLYTTDDRGEITITGVTGTLVVEETRAPEGYAIDTANQRQTVTVNPDDTQTLTFRNDPLMALTITKYITGTKTPLAGVRFIITSSDGTVIGPANGEFETDRNGRIVLTGLVPGTTITARETRAADGYILDGTPQSILIREGETQSMTFYNTPAGGLIITKSDVETGARLSGVRFEVQKKNGEIIGTYTTDRNGVIRLPDLESGWYAVIEREAASGYFLDATPQEVEVKDGETAVLALTNRKTSNILIHKIDADTGKGIYGVTFLLYDSSHNPIGECVSDNNGYVYLDSGLTDGRYYIRELKAADGYIPDNELKTFYVRYGATGEITWKNTAIRGQIQIVKKSANDNPINGLPAGTLLEGAVFEICDKSGNLVDTIRTGRDGRAASRLLPLSRYTVKEVTAPNYYTVNPTIMTAYLEHQGQIVSFEVLDESVATGVSIKKSGYAEVMPGGSLRYAVTQIANTSTVPLSSFYWRDTLPGQITLAKVITGTYNQALSYKIVYRTNTSGDTYLTMADNLSTTKNYVLDAAPAALGLAANERVTELMFVFGQVKGGFAEVETAYLYATANSGLSNGSSIVNVADVGGLYNGQWIQGVSRWTTTVYSKTTTTLPKTGY